MTQLNNNENRAAPIPQWPQAARIGAADARQKPSYFSRRQLVSLGLSFIITAGAAGLCGLIAGQTIAKRQNTALQLAPSRAPLLASEKNSSSPAEPAPAEPAAATLPIQSKPVSKAAAELTLPQLVSATAPHGKAATGKIKTRLTLNTDKIVQANDFEAKPMAASPVKKDLAASPWSVQISATQDQIAAQLLQDKLKSKGFDAFIVPAEINSGYWYRVRVGRFSTNEEAEKTRQDLQSKENLASAFVTGK